MVEPTSSGEKGGKVRRKLKLELQQLQKLKAAWEKKIIRELQAAQPTTEA
jgi:hypothetical protein